MLLTITTTRAPATDLEYLLHKRPGRVQSFDVASGTAHVFYPEAAGERCTAALLLAVALKRVFSTALTGRCEARPELAATPIPLEIRVPALLCSGGPELAGRGVRAARLGGQRRGGAARPAVVGHLGVPGPAADRHGL